MLLPISASRSFMLHFFLSELLSLSEPLSLSDTINGVFSTSTNGSPPPAAEEVEEEEEEVVLSWD